ncbi:hypothetical protein SUGI_0073600 [Cryptomeria japonica]|nr:hypothetical protein SUGI_0073600 [Cryptomeria japonica]
MSENEECPSCESLTSVGNTRTMTEDNEQPWNHLKHANLLLEDPTSSETSWTNEKHSLYLNSIEDAFVSSLYQQGYYTYPCKRWQADRGEISSALSLDSNEEVESGFSDGPFVFGFPEESQSESEMPRIRRHAQNHSKRCRFKKMVGSNDRVQESNRNEKRNKRKFQHEVSDPGKQITHVWEVLQSRHNDQTASNFCGQHQLTQNRILSGTITNNQEDQVVPSIDEKSAKEDGKPR